MWVEPLDDLYGDQSLALLFFDITIEFADFFRRLRTLILILFSYNCRILIRFRGGIFEHGKKLILQSIGYPRSTASGGGILNKNGGTNRTFYQARRRSSRRGFVGAYLTFTPIDRICKDSNFWAGQSEDE